MTRQQIESSNLASVGYDDATLTLEVEFKPNNSGVSAVWQYRPVGREIYDAMIDPNNSAGGVFASIKKMVGVGVEASKVDYVVAAAEDLPTGMPA